MLLGGSALMCLYRYQGLSFTDQTVRECEPIQSWKGSRMAYYPFWRSIHVCFSPFRSSSSYHTCLSIYDIPMCLLIATKSQMDPRDYKPFLNRLYSLTPLYVPILSFYDVENNIMRLTSTWTNPLLSARISTIWSLFRILPYPLSSSRNTLRRWLMCVRRMLSSQSAWSSIRTMNVRMIYWRLMLVIWRPVATILYALLFINCYQWIASDEYLLVFVFLYAGLRLCYQTGRGRSGYFFRMLWFTAMHSYSFIWRDWAKKRSREGFRSCVLLLVLERKRRSSKQLISMYLLAVGLRCVVPLSERPWWWCQSLYFDQAVHHCLQRLYSEAQRGSDWNGALYQVQVECSPSQAGTLLIRTRFIFVGVQYKASEDDPVPQASEWDSSG